MAKCTRRMFDELDPLARKTRARVRDRFPRFDCCAGCDGTGWREHYLDGCSSCTYCGGTGRKTGPRYA